MANIQQSDVGSWGRVCVSGEKTIQAGGSTLSPADWALLHGK